MNSLNQKIALAFKNLLVITLFAGALLFGFPLKLLSLSNDVTFLYLEIKNCTLNFIVYPEKRIPRVNNWSTVLDIEIISPSQGLVASTKVKSNNLGEASVNYCDQGLNIKRGNYNIAISGASHLRKVFTNISLFKDSKKINLSVENSELLAGETSVIKDNKINSLDISTQIKFLYTNDYKNDLNQDGKVNSLDLSNTITNFYKTGDL